MIRNIYAVRDDLVGFGHLTLDTSDAVAMRGFRAAMAGCVKRGEVSDVSYYSLYCLGSYDEASGVITPLAAPRRVCDAIKEDD